MSETRSRQPMTTHKQNRQRTAFKQRTIDYSSEYTRGRDDQWSIDDKLFPGRTPHMKEGHGNFELNP